MPNNKINPSKKEHSPAEGISKEKKTWTVVKTAARVGRAIGFYQTKTERLLLCVSAKRKPVNLV
jgi:hypothetical protein